MANCYDWPQKMGIRQRGTVPARLPWYTRLRFAWATDALANRAHFFGASRRSTMLVAVLVERARTQAPGKRAGVPAHVDAADLEIAAPRATRRSL